MIFEAPSALTEQANDAAPPLRHGRRRRALFIAYALPPVGGAGVQRVTKLLKYLPEHGWDCSVLTVANPSVPVFDHSLTADIPDATVIRRARTLEPGYAAKAAVSNGAGSNGARRTARRLAANVIRQTAGLVLQPDPQILWYPRAVREGRRLLGELPHDAIIATGPPFSAFLIGAALSRRSKLPLVLDYRDEWDLSNRYWENRQHGRWSRFLQQRLQARAVRCASALVATTDASRQSVAEVGRRAGSAAEITCIYNGYDPGDFAPEIAVADRPCDRFRLVYTGTLWNLTSVAPLARAVAEMARTMPQRLRHLELVFAGRRTPEQEQLVKQLHALPCLVTERSYLAHHESVALVRSADALCLLLSDLPGAGRVVPAKLFEYFAAQRPIVAICPPGEVWNLLAAHPAADRLAPTDVAGIIAALTRAIDNWQHGHRSDWSFDAAAYNRRHQAGQYANLLNRLSAMHRT